MAGYRDNADIINGSMLMVFIGDNPIAFATSHSISFTTNTTEVSTKDHGLFPSTLAQSQTWEVSCENLASADSINSLFDALNKAKNNTTVTLKFGKPGNWDDKGIVGSNGLATNWSPSSGDILAQGDALLTSLSINAPAGDNATLSATFTGVGAFTLTAADADVSGDTGPQGPTGPFSTGS